MRAYFFTNMYLSSIQQGIQPLHIVAEMFCKYIRLSEDYELVMDDKYRTLATWAKDHKTVICLNGGYSENLHNIIAEHLTDDDNPYPWEVFREGQDALGGALTSVGIILPEKMYEGASLIRNPEFLHDLNLTKSLIINDLPVEYTEWEINFMQEMNNYGLAK